jgi:hypothetical protein
MRPLGSFNNLGPRKYDNSGWKPKSEPPVAENLKARLGYLMGVNKNVIPYERPSPESTGPGISGAPKKDRMAGQALSTFYSTGAPAEEDLAFIGNAEQRTPYL